MIYIALTIIFSTTILVTFRLLSSSKANTRHAIIVNYLAASVISAIAFELSPDTINAPWFWPTIAEGVLFYVVFMAMAKTAQINGVATAGIASKMSVVIPISVGIFWLNETATTFKILGIFAGFFAVLLVAGRGANFNQWKWPLISFLGIGLIDTSLKLFQVWGVSDAEFPEFISSVFGTAFLVGVAHHFTFSKWAMNVQSISIGAFLGLCNFATLFCFMTALSLPNWESSIVFPITNFGIVALATLLAVVLFHEQLTTRVRCGLGCAFLSICLLYISGSS